MILSTMEHRENLDDTLPKFIHVRKDLIMDYYDWYYRNNIASPDSSKDLERITDKIYREKPWGGWHYKILCFLTDWTLTTLITIYALFTHFFSFSSLFVFALFTLLFDFFIQKRNVVDTKLIVKEIVQQSFETGFKKGSLVNFLSGTLLIFLSLIILVRARKHFNHDISEYSSAIMTPHFLVFLLSLAIFATFLMIFNLRQAYINVNIDSTKLKSVWWGGYEIGEKALHIESIADGSNIHRGIGMIYFTLFGLFSIILWYFITRPFDFGGSLMALYIMFFVLFLARTLTMERIGRYSAQHYLDHYIQKNGKLKEMG